MKLYKVTDKAFSRYGQVLRGYDFEALFSALANLPVPREGIVYEASADALEATSAYKALGARCFGGMPIQIGYVGGNNRQLGCLEYHKSSECNIALDDVVLLLGLEQEIENGVFDTSKCKAFLVPAGVGVELYGTTLHYAPMNVSEESYRVACVLPRGTNGEKPQADTLSVEDRMCAGSNKWLLAHPASDEAGKGMYVGLSGENLRFSDIEF